MARFGVFGYSSIHSMSAFNTMLPFLNGWHFLFRWEDVEPTAGVFDYTTMDAQIEIAYDAGLYITFMVFTGDFAPTWLYSAPYSVPKVETTLADYPYYLNPSTFAPGGTYAYLTRWNNMLDNVRAHIATLPAYQAGKILFWQSAEGKTGDEPPYGGTIVDVTINGVSVADPTLYDIELIPDWDTYKKTSWALQSANIAADIPLTKLMINPANNGQNWAFKESTYPTLPIKAGDFSHNYSFLGESYYANFVQGQNDLGLYVRGEIDDPPLGDAWWQTAPNKSTMAMLASCLHAGLNQWNLAISAYQNNTTGTFAYDFYNEFAGYSAVNTTNTGFLYFRDVLDINDTTRFPEGTYGNVIDPAQLAAYTSDYNTVMASSKPAAVKLYNITYLTVYYLNPARKTAIEAAFPNAVYGMDLTRDTDELNNDFGCDVVSGNWCRNIEQYDQFNTTTSHWRIGANSEYLGRYGSSVPVKSYFSTTLTSNTSYTATFTIYYYDGAVGVSRLKYYNGMAEDTAGTITTTNTGTFLSQTITIFNFYGGGHLSNNNDFAIEYISGNVIIFGLVKLSVNQNSIPPMADLSAYIDFSIIIDRSDVDNPVIRITDPNDYPAPIGIYLEGVLSITQPDGISIDGDFEDPDIYWDGSELVTAVKELRLSDDDTIQNGIYTITYTVAATGYSNTVLTKTVDLTYDPVTQVITDLVDVFTPSLKELDATIYTLDGFNTPTITRTWTAVIKYIGTSIATITGTTALFDMIYSSHYWDANYAITLETTLLYVVTADTWCTVKDKLTQTSQVDAYTPPSLATLAADLLTMKSEIEAGTYCGGSNSCGCDIDYTPYTTAQALYNLIVANGQAGQTVGLYTTMDELLKLLNCSGLNPQTHTYTYISAYNFGTASLGGITPKTITFTVGLSGMNPGDTVYTISDRVSNSGLQIFYNGIAVPNATDSPYTFNYTAGYGASSTTITFSSAVAYNDGVIISYYQIASS